MTRFRSKGENVVLVGGPHAWDGHTVAVEAEAGDVVLSDGRGVVHAYRKTLDVHAGLAVFEYVGNALFQPWLRCLAEG